MTGRSAPSRGALPVRQASYVAMCIVMLVATVALEASVPSFAGAMIAVHTASPQDDATPSAESDVDWSNGAESFWTFESRSDQWAERFPLVGGGVFGVARRNSGVLQVFDAVTLERLWVLSISRGGYEWQPTAEAFMVRHDSSLAALDPRNGTVLWERDFPGKRWEWTTDDHIAGASTRLPRFIYITNEERLTILEFDSGETLFEMPIAGDTLEWETEDDIMTVTSGNSLKLVDLDAGKERWSYDGQGTAIGWSIDDSRWYVTSGGVLAAIDPTTGEEIWRFAGSDDWIFWEMGKDAMYVRSGKGVSALDPANGTELWRFTAGDQVGSLRIIDGMLFAKSGPTLSAINKESGVELWRYSMANAEDPWWGVVEDERAIYMWEDSTITLLDIRTGVEAWRFTDSGAIEWMWSAEGPFIVSTDTSLIAIDATTGIEHWRVTTNAAVDAFSDDGDQFTFIAVDTLFAIDASTGDELWRTRKLTGLWSASLDPEWGVYEVLADKDILLDARTGETLLSGRWRKDNDVLFTNDGTGLAAYDLDTREVIWRHRVSTSLVIRSVDGQTLMYSTGQTIVALDKTTGTELWTFMADASIESFDMDEGVIRLTDSYGTLYALAPKPIQLEAGGTAVTTEKVTLRGAPNESAVERTVLPAGAAVTITGAADESSGDTWWPVTTGKAGEQGWVPEEVLAPTGNAPGGTETPAA